jgi:hypothetical protein
MPPTFLEDLYTSSHKRFYTWPQKGYIFYFGWNIFLYFKVTFHAFMWRSCLYKQADKLFRASHGFKETGMAMEKELDILMDAAVSCDTDAGHKQYSQGTELGTLTQLMQKISTLIAAASDYNWDMTYIPP